jgi:uncharacterized protein YgiM (DUF1202 family)
MEEWSCDRRKESQPKLAIVYADDVNLRAEPTLKSQVIGKLRVNQVVRLLKVAPECSRIEIKEDIHVGRWIKVRTSNASQKMEGWVFDIYVQYDNENRVE